MSMEDGTSSIDHPPPMIPNIRSFLAGIGVCAALALIIAFRPAPSGYAYRIVSAMELSSGSGDPRLILEGAGDAERAQALSGIATGMGGKIGKYLGTNDRTVEAALNELASQGWELMDVAATSLSPAVLNGGTTTGGGLVTRFVFRKPA